MTHPRPALRGLRSRRDVLLSVALVLVLLAALTTVVSAPRKVLNGGVGPGMGGGCSVELSCPLVTP